MYFVHYYLVDSIINEINDEILEIGNYRLE